MTITATFNKNQACYNCGSIIFSVTSTGFTVCNRCGCEQDFENISTDFGNHDYTEKGIPKSSAVMGVASSTMIGSPRERRSMKIQNLQTRQEQSLQLYERVIQISAYKEIMRITSLIGLSKDIADRISVFFQGIWHKITTGRKSHSISILVPVVIYRCASILKYTVNIRSILAHATCSKHDFNSVFQATYNLFTSNDKFDHIIIIIKEIAKKMGMSEIIVNRAIEILTTNSARITNTTSGVAAAASVGIAVLSLGLKTKYAMYKIGESIHVSASAIDRKILGMFKLKSGPLRMRDLEERMPRIYTRLISKCHKTTAMARIYREISSRISKVADELNMPPIVRERSQRILKSNLQTMSMTILDIAGATCVTMAVLSLQLRNQYRIFKIAKALDISQSAINARMYKVLSSRKIDVDYRVYELEEIIPTLYSQLVGESKNLTNERIIIANPVAVSN